jgi:hypothetical protein
MGLLFGCGEDPQGQEGSADDPQKTIETADTELSEATLSNTYWTAVRYSKSGSEEILELPEGRSTDLIILEEGAARFRNTKNYTYIEETAVFADSTWDIDDDGNTFSLSVYDSQEKLTGWLEEGKLLITTGQETFIMEKGDLPVSGAEWLMADLAGNWKLVTSEIEGYEATAEELGLEGSVSFLPADDMRMAVDYWLLDEYGNETFAFGENIEYKEEQLHEGCENESWIVSFASEDGKTEYYATMKNRDYLRMMIFSYMEDMEYPAVVVQNFLWQGNGSGAVG